MKLYNTIYNLGTPYLLVEALYQNLVTKPLRSKGFAPALSDAEIIAMELVGECLGFDADKGIWSYFKNCYKHYFPNLGFYPNFAKGVASFGYCASKDERYFGFKAHLMTSKDGQILSYTLTPANTDDGQAVFELTQARQLF